MVARLRVTTNQKDPLTFFSPSSDTLNISQGGIMVKKPVVKKSATETGKDKTSKIVKPQEKQISTTSQKKVDSQTPRADRHCAIASCKREYRAKGYCNSHYKKWKQGAYGIARFSSCGDLDCTKPMSMNRHGYCEDHYQNYYVKGLAVTKVAPIEKPAPVKKEAVA